MKRMLLFLLTPLFLLSCAKSEPLWRDDLSCGEIADVLSVSLPDRAALIRREGSEADTGGLPDIPDSLTEDCWLLIQSNRIAIDEVGVYLARDNAAGDKIQERLEGYLADSAQKRREGLDASLPGESEKIDQAQILRRGRYVVYLILSKADRRIATENLEKILAR